MTYQLLHPQNLAFQVLAGNCLAMAQGIAGAPVRHPSATAAADATTIRHYDRDVPVGGVVWLDHWGSYGDPGREVYANWGHVVVRTPRGFASSSPVPGEVSGPYYYASIAEVERVFSCSFRFWSEDINGLRAVESEDEVTPEDIKKIAAAVLDVQVPRAGAGQKGKTTLRSVVAWIDYLTDPARILDAKVPRKGTGQTGNTTLRSIVAWFDSLIRSRK